MLKKYGNTINWSKRQYRKDIKRSRNDIERYRQDIRKERNIKNASNLKQVKRNQIKMPLIMYNVTI